MAIAELFIGAVITVLFEKLTSPEFIRLARSAGISSKVEKLKNILPLIQAVLADAAEKQIANPPVQLWLNKLQHLAYEIDDVLDDLTTEAKRSQLNQESDASTSNNTSKVLKFIPTKFHALKYNRKMSAKLDEITTNLCDLVGEKKFLGLTDKVEMPNRAATTKRKEQTSLLPMDDVIGRESDKEALLEKLLGSESSTSKNVSVVSIVGMGGIGKTTLAQLLYNDEKVKNHFELMSWVCISDEFDAFNISNAILHDVGGGSKEIKTLNQLQVALTEKLSKKRFLIVLDDVWNENGIELESFQCPFTVGAHGSKILVTTRKATVASTMKSVQAYSLELLSHNEALSLFAQHASDKQDCNVSQKLEMYGDDIVKKCGRLPLALKILGSAFYGKSSDEEWEKILNNEIWSFDKEDEILPALKLGYYDLLPHLKQMFAYCRLFPKDYMFDKDELVLLWMAEGFLCESNGNKSMESFGRECFEELASRSFFQHSNNDKSRYTMHDLIHDLARSVAGESFFTLEAKMYACDRNEALEKFHHISFILERERYAFYRKLEALQRTRCLRTFLAMPITRLNYLGMIYLPDKILVTLLTKLRFLRVLSLANSSIKEVPESIDTPNLNDMPLGFGGLTGLQTLSKVIIGGSGGFRISYLKDFLHLRGHLSIKGLHKVKHAMHAKEANLQQKKGICDLQLKWNDVFDGSRNELTEYEVLEKLRPFEKLRSLKILYYGGTKFPSWVGDPSFVYLTQLTLTDCRSCKCLPTLGYLPSLIKLCVESIHELDKVGSELLGQTNSCSGNAFPSLEVLEFTDMPNWKEWSTHGGEKRGIFPCLREISIVHCPKLDVVVISSMPSLRVLYLSRCSVAVLKSMVGVSSSIGRLEICNIEGLTQLHGEVLEHLRAVEYLKISDCSKLRYLWESEVAACKILKNLQMLEISDCKELVSVGEKELPLGISIESVTEVTIKCCRKLKSYNCPKRIEKLIIQKCPLVTLTDGLPSTLKFLHVNACDNLEVRWPPINNLSSLESLVVDYMPKLRLFPEGCLSYLTKLTIWGCDNIESVPCNGYGFLPSLCLKELTITKCKNLKSFPHEHLQSLTSLEEVSIHSCPNMDYSFPCGVWPPNLSILSIGELKKPISEWGLQNFPTSLDKLCIYGGDSGVVSFAAKGDEEDISSFLLPSSLTELYIDGFKELESVSEGLQHITCLQRLVIQHCWKLRDLPETLPPSLSCLIVCECSSELRKKCSRKGKYWPIISQIPGYSVR
ncbi:putative P-loop containing nucleoside triphosphate hydrolase, leucine-rich repeat domain superfamily [Helianthus debilis subsp. tardiflorus]